MPLQSLHKYFTPSHNLMISCGCVTVDPSTRKVAILGSLRNPSLKQLPKGRKNIHEDLLATALRETYEETGVKVEALPLKVATRATPTPDLLPAAAADKSGSGAAVAHLETENPDVTDTILNTEPSSVSVYPFEGEETMKLVFWFAAKGDSTAAPEEGTQEAWEEYLKVEWVDVDQAAGMMTYSSDRDAVRKVLEDMRSSGYEI